MHIYTNMHSSVYLMVASSMEALRGKKGFVVHFSRKYAKAHHYPMFENRLKTSILKFFVHSKYSTVNVG